MRALNVPALGLALFATLSTSSCTQRIAAASASQIGSPTTTPGTDPAAVVALTTPAERRALEFIQLLRSGQVDATYSFGSPEYQRTQSARANQLLISGWLDMGEKLPQPRLVDRSVGIDLRERRTYVKLQYEVAVPGRKGEMSFTFVPVSGDWRISTLGLHWASPKVVSE